MILTGTKFTNLKCVLLLFKKGCGFTTYGPAITSLQNKYNVDDSTISTVFTILTCGNMVGGLCGIFFISVLNLG